MKSIVKNALDGLRSNGDFIHGREDEMLVHDAHTPSIIRGRSVQQSLTALSSTETFTIWKFEGLEDDPIPKICRDLVVLVESVDQNPRKDTRSLESVVNKTLLERKYGVEI